MAEREVLEAQTRLLGAKHPDTLATKANIADSIWAQGRHAEAMQIFREVHTAQTQVLGAEHPDTLITKSNLEHRQSFSHIDL